MSLSKLLSEKTKLTNMLVRQRHLAINHQLLPDEALSVVSNYNYANQRPHSKSHTLVLAEAMRRGEFREFTSIDFAVLDGVPHLINGQHTLRAVVSAKKPIWLSIHFHKVDSSRDIEALYSKYDIGRTRSLRDAMGVIGEELGFTVKERDALAVAVGWINLGFRMYSGKDDPVRIFEAKDFELKKSLMRDWAVEASRFFGCIKTAPGFNKALYFRGAVLAVALITLRYNEEKAVEFWSGSALDDGLRNGDPRKALINWLRNNPVGKAPHMQHRAVMACWNSWFKEKSLTKVYPDAGSSLTILGSPIEISGNRT
jgi:hypothetical protein